MPKVTSVISTSTSQSPRLIRNRLASFLDFFRDDRYAEIPERNTKVGAQKWVIHLVKYNQVVVVFGSSGSAVIAVS